MKTKPLFGTIIALILVALGVLTVLVLPKRADPGAGIIRFPFYRGTATMDAARDMIHALDWQLEFEGGDPNQVTFRAIDQNDKAVTFTFHYYIVGSRAVVSAEKGTRYSVEEITKELARRIGIAVPGNPLPAVPKPAPTNRQVE